MKPATAAHPTPDELAAFGLGKLPPHEQAQVERHVATCDACCANLGALPDDTLLGRLRSSSTTREFDPAVLQNPAPQTRAAGEIPPELVDHPRYRVIKLLGAGGMGEVYQAEHRIMERPVALKVISPKLTRHPKAIERFRLEVKAAGKLVHPNIVVAHDADQAGELHFLVMEFVDGLSIEQLVKQKGPLPIVNACNFAKQAAQGLQHAHEKRQMVHRDIKPQNLMIARGGQVKILDFGLARFVREQVVAEPPSGEETHHGENDQLTRVGMMVGTPDYMAPEQAADSHAADIRADIYSLGCTLYYMLAGRPPFALGTALDKLESHANATPEPLGTLRDDVPAELLAIIDRLMAKDPAARFQRPAEVVKALGPWSKVSATPAIGRKSPEPLAEFPLLAELPPPSPVANLPVAPWQQAARRPAPVAAWFRTHRLPLLAAGAVAILLLASIAMMVGAAYFVSDLLAKGGGPAKGTSNDEGTTKSKSQSSGLAGVGNAIAGTRGKRVLFVVPKRGLYYPDYGPVRERLEREGVKVTTVSSSAGPVGQESSGASGQVVAEKGLESVNAADYDAVIFAGLQVWEYASGPQKPNAKRLIDEMFAAKKPVTALCTGQGVLAAHGVLDGRRVALNDKVRNGFPNSAVDTGERVTQDGLLITGRDANCAGEFADVLLEALGQAR